MAMNITLTYTVSLFTSSLSIVMGYLDIYGFTIQACLDAYTILRLYKTICFNFCVNLNICSEFTETLALTIEMDILDMMPEMDGHGWITQFG